MSYESTPASQTEQGTKPSKAPSRHYSRQAQIQHTRGKMSRKTTPRDALSTSEAHQPVESLKARTRHNRWNAMQKKRRAKTRSRGTQDSERGTIDCQPTQSIVSESNRLSRKLATTEQNTTNTRQHMQCQRKTRNRNSELRTSELDQREGHSLRVPRMNPAPPAAAANAPMQNAVD